MRRRGALALGLDPHPGTDPHHDAVLDIGDAIDAAALRLRGHDRICGGNSSLHAGNMFGDLGFEGTQVRQFWFDGIAIAERGSRLRSRYAGQADFAGAFGAASIFGRPSKIIVMGF